MFYLFNNIKDKDILDSFLKAYNSKGIDDIDDVSSKLLMFSTKMKITGNLWRNYLLYTLVYNDNPFTRAIELNQKCSGYTEFVDKDLKQYFDLYNLDTAFLGEINNYDFLKETGSHYLRDILIELTKEIKDDYKSFKKAILNFYKTKGLGEMAIYKAFRVNDGKLLPIKHVLDINFDYLVGYEFQKSLLRENTIAFLNNKPYNNVLLYGDAGTGKSTSIKALINEYFDKGLRIIEVYKHQMHEISKIINDLKSRPYHYVIYMDDLSFEESEVEYKYLKSIIEGGIEPKPENVVVYATSNRRHLIKETFKDNGGVFDDIHRNETQAEKLSLAYRFGLQIYYSSLSPQEFKDMVLELAKRNDINLDEKTLLSEANKFQMSNGSLSGRCASQFISYISGIDKNEL
ncbi:MAG: ATP-binding protein [Acholeplasmatales bacterium]|nr:ATP-binding protein [Acholeplasmatales bacterium]